MKLEEYKKIIELQLMTDNGLHNILKAKKKYENNKIDQEFENARLFKPITDSNKDRIEKKTEDSDELIKKITDALPYYNQNTQQASQEPLTNDKTIIGEPSEDEDIMKDFDNGLERNFIKDLIKGKKVYLYDRKKPNSKETEPIFSNIQLIDLNNLSNKSDAEINELLKSQELLSLSNSLATVGGNRKNDTLLSYSNSLKKYKKKLKDEIVKRSKQEVENTPECLQQTNTSTVK